MAKRRRDERKGRGAGEEEEEQEKAKRKTKKQRAKRGDRTVLSAFIRHEDSLLSEVPVRVTPSAIDDPSLSKSVFSCWRREHCCHKLSLSSNFFHSLPSKISLPRGRARPLSFSVDGSSRRNEFRSSDFLLDSWFTFLPGWMGGGILQRRAIAALLNERSGTMPSGSATNLSSSITPR